MFRLEEPGQEAVHLQQSLACDGDAIGRQEDQALLHESSDRGTEAVEYVDVINNPEDPSAGTRKVPFSRELYIERDDFRKDPPKKFFRLAPGREVGLRCAYFVTCSDVITDPSGEIVALRCTYDPSTRGGDAPDGRKVRGTLHWLSAAHAQPAEVRLYETLFAPADPMDVPEGTDWIRGLNPRSLEVLRGAFVEPALASAKQSPAVTHERVTPSSSWPAAANRSACWPRSSPAPAQPHTSSPPTWPTAMPSPRWPSKFAPRLATWTHSTTPPPQTEGSSPQLT